MSENKHINELSPWNRRIVGASLLVCSFFLTYLFYHYPEKLNVPFWLGMVVCGCIFIVGVAVTLYGFISLRAYNFLMLLFLVLMSIVPAWIVFGSGDRECSSNIPFFSGEYSCRVAFGLSFFMMLFFVGVAYKMVFSSKKKE